MTSITSNGISLGFVKTNRVGQQAVYDPVSQTDMMYTKFTIQSSSVLAVPTALAGESPADTMKRIRHMLLVPRRAFSMSVGGREMIAVSAIDADGNALDDANGPKPISCDISQITESTFKIDYAIEVCLTDCDNLSALRNNGNRGAAVRPEWLSMRYTMSHDINEEGYSTISVDGGLTCKSSLLASGGPDTLRGMVTPLPIPGFKRHSKYTISADGLTLHFSITDTEMYITPPPGTVKARGTHTVSTPNGGKFIIDVNLTLEGRKETPKKDLLQMAVAIAYDRVERSTPATLKGMTILAQGSFTDEMYGPGVTVHLQAIANGPKVIREQKKASAALKSILNTATFGTTAMLDALFSEQKKQGDREIKKIIDNFEFGGDPLGSSRNAPILMTFGERGYLPFLYLIASGFNDPCLLQMVSLPAQEVGVKTGLINQAIKSVKGGLINPAAANNNLNTGGDAGLKTAGEVLNANAANLQKGVVSANVASLSDSSTISIASSLEAFSDTGDSPYVAAETTSGVWEYHAVKYSYHRDTGKRAMPAMQAGATVAYPKIHDDVMTIKVQWVVKKTGEPPTIPNPEPADDNYVLLDAIEGYPSVDVAGDGESVQYTHEGEYLYGVVDWTEVDKDWPIPPWLAINRSELEAIKLGEAIDGSTAGNAAEGQLKTVGA